MENEKLWTIIGVAFIVAIVTSIATVSITGNVTNSASRTTNQIVLNMLENNCIGTNSVLYNVTDPTGAQICDAYNSKQKKSTMCALVQQGKVNSIIAPCNLKLGTDKTVPNYVICCSP